MSNIFGGIPPPAQPEPGTASRSLNTAFQVSTTRNALVVYSVQITVTATIAGGQNGDVVLETADDSGFTQNVQGWATIGNGQTYSLAVALQGVQPNTILLVGMVMAGKWLRIRPVNNTGAPAYSVRQATEILL